MSTESENSIEGKIAIFQKRIDQEQKVPGLPIISRACSTDDLFKEKFVKKAATAETPHSARVGRAKNVLKEVKEENEDTTEIDSNGIQEMKEEETKLSGARGLPDILTESALGFVESTFPHPLGNVHIIDSPLQEIPAYGKSVSPDGKDPLKDVSGVKKRLDPEGDELAPRFVVDALVNYRTDIGKLKFPRGRLCPDPIPENKGNLATDELYYYPETGEREGKKSIEEPQVDSTNWWKYMRDHPPPNFFDSRPELVHAYPSFYYPRKNKGIQISADVQTSPPVVDFPACRFMFSCEGIKIDGFEQIEPFRCEAFVVDVRKKCRITETFRFLLDRNIPEPDIRKCVFIIPSPSIHLCLIVKVNRVLTGDTSQFEQFYLKGVTPPKELKKHITSVKSSEKHLKDYSQGFCAGSMPLFEQISDNKVHLANMDTKSALEIPLLLPGKNTEMITLENLCDMASTQMRTKKKLKDFRATKASLLWSGRSLSQTFEKTLAKCHKLNKQFIDCTGFAFGFSEKKDENVTSGDVSVLNTKESALYYTIRESSASGAQYALVGAPDKDRVNNKYIRTPLIKSPRSVSPVPGHEISVDFHKKSVSESKNSHSEAKSASESREANTSEPKNSIAKSVKQVSSSPVEEEVQHSERIRAQTIQIFGGDNHEEKTSTQKASGISGLSTLPENKTSDPTEKTISEKKSAVGTQKKVFGTEDKDMKTDGKETDNEDKNSPLVRAETIHEFEEPSGISVGYSSCQSSALSPHSEIKPPLYVTQTDDLESYTPQPLGSKREKSKKSYMLEDPKSATDKPEKKLHIDPKPTISEEATQVKKSSVDPKSTEEKDKPGKNPIIDPEITADKHNKPGWVAEMGPLPVDGKFPYTQMPYRRYLNFLYVYPQHLNISSHRNLTIVTQLYDIDEPNAKPLNAIYGRPGTQLTTKHISPMTYHLKRPKFFEEVKIVLPNHLKPTHHIRFSFINVSLKKLKRGLTNASLDRLTGILGYSFVPLLRGGRVLEEFHTLRIYSRLSASYLHKESLGGMRKNPSLMKGLFSVKTNLLSTVYTNDPHISAFAHAMERMFFPSKGESKDNEESLSDRLCKTTNRSEKAQKVLEEEEDAKNILYLRNLYSGIVSKRGNLSSWTDRWFVMRKRPNTDDDGSLYDLVYFSDSHSVGREEPRLICKIQHGLRVHLHDKRGPKGMVAFDIESPNIELPIQLCVQTMEEFRAWQRNIHYAILARETKFSRISTVASGNKKELSRFSLVILKQVLRAICYAGESETRISLFRTLLHLFHSLKDAGRDSISEASSKNQLRKRGSGFIIGNYNVNKGSASIEMDFEPIHAEVMRSKLLEQFVEYYFREYAMDEYMNSTNNTNFPKTSNGLVDLKVMFPRWSCMAISDAWHGTDDRRTVGSASEFSWILLGIIYKSMVFQQNFYAEKGIEPDLKQQKRTLTNLIYLLGKRVAGTSRGQTDIDRSVVLNRSVGRFLRDCYQILARPYCTDLVAKYFEAISSRSSDATLGGKLLEAAARSVEPPDYLTDAQQSCLKTMELDDNFSGTQIDTLQIATRRALSRTPKGLDEKYITRPSEPRGSSVTECSGEELGPSKCAGEILSNADSRYGHFFPRWLSAELSSSLARRGLLAPNKSQSLLPIRSLARLLRTFITTDLHSSMEEKDLDQEGGRKALISQAYLSILRVLWNQVPTLETIRGTRALKDLLFVFLHVIRSVPAHWIKKAINSSETLVHVPLSDRDKWFRMMIRICTLVLEELKHRINLPTNILKPPDIQDDKKTTKPSETVPKSNPDPSSMKTRKFSLGVPKKKTARRKRHGKGSESVDSNIIKNSELCLSTPTKAKNVLSKSSRIFFSEACHIVLDLITYIIVPLANNVLKSTKKTKEEDTCLMLLVKFLLSVLQSNTAVRVRRRVCMTISWLLRKYEKTFPAVCVPKRHKRGHTLKKESEKGDYGDDLLRIPTGDTYEHWEKWMRYFWYQMIRQATFPGSLQRDSLSVLYQVSHIMHLKYGTAGLFRRAAMDGFSDVVENVLLLMSPLDSGGVSDVLNPFVEESNDKDVKEEVSEKESEDAKSGETSEKARAPKAAASMPRLEGPGSLDMEYTNGSDLTHAVKVANERPMSPPNYKSQHPAKRTQSEDLGMKKPKSPKNIDHAQSGRRAVSHGQISNRLVKESNLPMDSLKKALRRLIWSAKMATSSDCRTGTIHAGYLSASTEIGSIFDKMVAVLTILRTPFPLAKTKHFIKEIKAGRYSSIISAYDSSPRLVRFYQNFLRTFHESNGDLPEAAYVSMEIAQRARERIEVYGEQDAQDEFSTMLRVASALYCKSNFMERAIAAEHQLLTFYNEHKQFGKASECYKRISDFSQKLLDFESGKDVRSLGTFYRVEFCGTRMLNKLRQVLPRPNYGQSLANNKVTNEVPLSGTKYIFREAKITRLMEICNRLKSLGALLGCSIVFLRSNKDEAKLGPNSLGIRLTTMDPVPSSGEFNKINKDVNGSESYLRHNETNVFAYETPFTKSGKSHGKTREQWRRKTFCRVAESFPFREKCQPIIHEECIEYTPIESSIQVVEKKVRDMKKKAFPADGSKAKLKTLYQVLSGCVNTQVHGGITEVAESFLAKEHVMEHPVGHIRKLKNAFEAFLHMAKKSLDVARELSDEPDESKLPDSPTALRMQDVLEEKFIGLKKTLNPFINIAREVISGKFSPPPKKPIDPQEEKLDSDKKNNDSKTN
ncbi:hypothetical protein AAMO2058_001062200 [Amorphochlora amoebiformis]